MRQTLSKAKTLVLNTDLARVKLFIPSQKQDNDIDLAANNENNTSQITLCLSPDHPKTGVSRFVGITMEVDGERGCGSGACAEGFGEIFAGVGGV
ncbi:MAG: hypothetical protein ABI462_14555 [Ignavibacteria bacterium]